MLRLLRKPIESDPPLTTEAVALFPARILQREGHQVPPPSLQWPCQQRADRGVHMVDHAPLLSTGTWGVRGDSDDELGDG